MKRTILFVVMFVFWVVGVLGQEEPQRISDIPPEHLDYSLLSAEQRLQMTAEQIAANFNNINNLMSDVNPDAAKEAIEETYGLADFQFSGFVFRGDGIQIRDDVLFATFGDADHITLSDEVYQQGFLEVTSDGVILFRPRIFPIDEVGEIMVPETDSLTVDTTRRTLRWEGLSVDGRLSFRKGQTFLRGGDSLWLDGIAISSDSNVDLFFDGREHAGDYFSINRKEGLIRIQSSTSSTSYYFLPGNGIFDMAEDSSLGLRPGHSKVIIQRRSAAGLIPLVIVEGDGLALRNGRNNYVVILGEFVAASYREDVGTSVPFTLRLRNVEGNPVLGTAEQEEQVLFDQANNYIIAPSRLPTEEVECLACSADFSQSLVLFNYYAVQMHATTNIEQLRATGNPLALQRILSFVQHLPPNVRDSIRGLWIVRDDEIEQYCGEKAEGCANLNGRLIVSESTSYDIVYHEAVHTRHYDIISSEGTLREGVGRLVELYGSLENPDPEVLATFSWDVQEFRRFAGTFENRWLSNAGDIYGEHLGEAEVGEGYAAPLWEDGSGEARYGCFRAYGCNNWFEDVATSIELFAEGDYGYVRELINPNSRFYQERMNQEIGDTDEIMTLEIAEDWARRYRQRVVLLHEYGFITDEDYSAVVVGSRK